MKILFICKYNRFRSKVAEAYFKKINKNKKIKISSAGLIKGKPTPLNTITIAKRFGINLKKTTNPIIEKDIEKIDLIIITANNIPLSLFRNYKSKIIKWKILDANANDNKNIIKSIKLIMNKIEKLVKKLEKEK